MKSLLFLFSLLPFSLFAHSGHPGPDAHGDATHLIVGLAIALPSLLLVYFLGNRSHKKAEVKVSKKD